MAATAVAVTGDVGAGKSTVARLFTENLRGSVTLDADAVAEDLWNRREIIEAAVNRWGGNILDKNGNIVKSSVASRIFSAPEEYKWCCGLLHPLVMDELKKRVAVLGAEQSAVVEIPLLFEAGRPEWVTSVVFVTAPRELRLKRRREQRGWDDAELARREKFFLPSDERIKLSDFVIDNSNGLHELEDEVRRIINNMRGE